MFYVKDENGNLTFPYSKEELRFNQTVSFPVEISDEIAAQYNVFPVTKTDEPAFDVATEDVVMGVEKIDVDYVQTWIVSRISDEEIQNRLNNKIMEIRNARNNLLARNIDCISPLWWEALTPEQQTSLRVYRQALLDISNQDGFPWNVTWPERPNF
jgi:hypothetical protein